MATRQKLPLIEDFNNIPEEALVPEAEQPYEIPKDWKWVRFEFLNNFVGKSVEPKKFQDEEFELYSVPSFVNLKPEKQYGSDIGSSKKLVEKNDVLLCKINPHLNRVWAITESSSLRQIASSEWIVFRPSYGTSKFYQIYFSSPYFRQKLLSRISGVGGSLTRVQPKVVAEYPVPLPPRDVQDSIVAYLEKTHAQIDEVLERTENFLDSYEAQKNALIHMGVSGKLTQSWRKRSGLNIDDWEKTTLGKAYKWTSGGTPSRKNPEYYTGTIPWIKSGELLSNEIVDSEEHITEEAIKNSSAKLFKPGTVLLAMYGATIGKVALLGTEAATNQAVAAATVGDDNNPRYLMYFLAANKQQFIALGKGGAQPNISQTIIKSFPYKRPTTKEQDEIVYQLDRELDVLAKAHQAVTQAHEQLLAFKENIVTLAMRGSMGRSRLP